ncbi:MAG: sugar ABC transporter permease [Planctomycetes bacterium]|nr:sugar ABC transporter permease [Planctomycetota bacterium]
MTSSRAAAPHAGAWLLIGPFLGIFALFTAYPLVRAVMLAFQQTFGPGAAHYVGWANFDFLSRDPMFWKAAKNTGVFTLGSILIQLPLSLALALLLNRPGLRGRAIYRTIFFTPALVGVVFVGMIFMLLFEKRTGLVNQALHAAIGVDLDFAWLETYIMPAMILATLWQYVGFNMVYFLAALQNVSRDLVEAATIDGAGAVGRFFHVTLPSIRPIASFVVLLSIVGSVQFFELPYVLLNGTGGPENRGLSIVMYLYQTGFQAGDLGYASAIAWVLAIVLAACTVAMRFLARGEDA